jgi:Raf kinase inhibitor-like YbhB/YbcL family protein
MDKAWCIVLFIILAVLVAGCSLKGGPGEQAPADGGSGSAVGTIAVISGAVLDNGSIPAGYGCRGLGTPMTVSWRGEPGRTRSVVLILEDPDAPGGVFTHWLLYNIPPGTLNAGNESIPGAVTGLNSAGRAAYFPPCPPAGESHRYLFRVYALDTRLDPQQPGREAVMRAMSGHVLATGSAGGMYSQ